MEKHLKKFIKEQELSNYSEDVAIFKQYHRSVIGKEGVVIKKIKDECGARIDVPSASRIQF